MVSYDFTYKYSDYFLNMALEIWAYWGTFQLSVVRTLDGRSNCEKESLKQEYPSTDTSAS